MDLRKLKKLIDLVQESGIAELEITEGEPKRHYAHVECRLVVSYSTCATAMVIPRAFSSGALSIESKLRNLFFGLCFDSVFVMAAVRVVLP